MFLLEAPITATRQVARDIVIAGMALAAFITGVGIFQAATYSHRAKAMN